MSLTLSNFNPARKLTKQNFYYKNGDGGIFKKAPLKKLVSDGMLLQEEVIYGHGWLISGLINCAPLQTEEGN